jgi:hypothetical protein
VSKSAVGSIASVTERPLQPVDQPQPRDVVGVGLDLDQHLSEPSASPTLMPYRSRSRLSMTGNIANSLP